LGLSYAIKLIGRSRSVTIHFVGAKLLKAWSHFLAFLTALPAVSGPPSGLALAATAESYRVSANQSQDASREASTSEQTDTLLQRAREFLQKGLLKDADRTVREYLDKHSNSADGHFLLGYILFKEQKPEASLAEYTEGAKYHDPVPSDLKIVALDYVLLNDYSDADRWLTRSVERDPKDSESWYYLGRTKYNENRFEEAIRAYQECLKLDSRNVKAGANLGLALEGLGRLNEAETAYRNAIAQQRNGSLKNAEPFIDLGNLLLEQNQIENAIAQLSEAREISPQESRARTSLGKAYLRLNKLEEAQEELEKAVSLDPNSAGAHYLLGQVYRKKGWIEQAKAQIDRAAALNEQKPPASRAESKP
jgi:Flp pilus assembly protein TadD